MKKFMKKAMSIIAGAAMAFTMVVVPSVKAEAADGDYILLGTITGWDAASAGQMTDEGNGKYTYTYSASIGDKMEFKIANAELFANDGGIVKVVISRDEFKAAQSEEFIDETFGGSLPLFLTAFTKRNKLSAKEIEEIRNLIDSYKEE